MKKLLLLPLLLSASLCFPQAWSGILATSRAIDWSSAGLPLNLPTGETLSNHYTPPARSQCGTTITSGATLSTIMTALQSCWSGGGGYVLLGPGTFTVPSGSYLGFYNQTSNAAYPGVTLRGSGPSQTFIALQGNLQFAQVYPVNTATITAPTSNSVTLSTTANLTVGNFMAISQCDSGYSGSTCATGSSVDNGGVYVCGYQNSACAINNNTTAGTRGQVQQVVVTAINAVTGVVNFTPALYASNWTTSQSMQATWITGFYNSNGLEDLTVDESGNSNTVPFYVNNCYACWVKGVRIIGSNNGNVATGLRVSGTKNFLMVNNYLFANALSIGSSRIVMDINSSSDDLELNNIYEGGDSWQGEGSSQGSVVACNYGTNGKTPYYQAAFYEHGAGSLFRLYEGNQAGTIYSDATNGTHNLETLFRNYLTGQDPPYEIATFCTGASCRGIKWDSFARFENAIGNAIGSSKLTTYEGNPTNGINDQIIFGFSLDYNIGGHNDPLVKTTSMRWGNYDSATGTVHWCGNSSDTGWSTTCSSTSEVPITLSGNAVPYQNPVPSAERLPASFFLGVASHPNGGTGLNWWKVCTSWTTFPTSCASYTTPPFPAIGPDVTGGPYLSGHAWDIPAALAYYNLPVDTSYQNSYTISSSTFTSGTMQLTFATGVLPAGSDHVMGKFSIVGGPCAGGEFTMTASDDTHMSYSLASSPGSCVGGVVKWPNIRQFDERVYATDPKNPVVAPAISIFTMDLPGNKGNVPAVPVVSFVTDFAFRK